MAGQRNQDDLVDVDLEEGSVWRTDHPRDSRWKPGVPVGCTEHDECSGVTAEERVEEERNREKAGQTQRRWTSQLGWTTQLRVTTDGKTLVEVQQMAVVTQVVNT